MQSNFELGRKQYLLEKKEEEGFSNDFFAERLAMSGALPPEAIARKIVTFCGITS